MRVCLRRIEAENNMQRFYALLVQPTLFGEWELVREFGRIGSPGRVMATPFPTETEAHAALNAIFVHKQAKGYVEPSCDSG